MGTCFGGRARDLAGAEPVHLRPLPGRQRLWQSDLFCGTGMVVLALLSYWSPTRYAHLLQLGVAGWLIGFGYFYGGHPAAPGYQNNIFVGLILVLLALIPNEASEPPRSWRRYFT